MAFTDFLFQGSPPPATTSTTSQQGQLPLWYSQYIQGLNNAAAAVGTEPYQAYGGQRIAQFRPEQVQGQQYAMNQATAWQPAMAQAGAAVARGAGPFDPNAVNQFMVQPNAQIAEIERQGLRNWSENLMPSIQDAFTMSGQPGSTRNLEYLNRGARDVNESIMAQSNLAREGALNQAMNRYGDWQNRAITGGGALSQLAEQQQGLDARTAAMMETVGRTGQQMDQANLDLAYKDFQEQRQYPQQQIGWMNQIAQGQNVPQGQTTTTTAPFQGSMGPSPLAQLASLYGVMRGMGATGNQTQAPIG